MTNERARANVDTEMEHRHAVSIVVNSQLVEVLGPRATGLEIKEASLKAGLPIEIGFQLIEELPHGRTRVVGDKDIVEVRPGSQFMALAPDDNS